MRAAQTKDTLYTVADRLFTEHGFDGVSIDAIVEAAGLSKGAFYVHFESKDALVSALVTDYVNKVDMDYQAFLDSLPPGQSAADTLLALVGRIFEVIEQQIGFSRIRVLYRTQLMNPGHAQSASGYSRGLYAMLGNVIALGVSRGEFKVPLPEEELARHMMLAMRGLTYEWCLRYPDYPLKERAASHFRLLLDGIRREG